LRYMLNPYCNAGALIVAGGLSSRMKDFKPLMKIGHKSVIETTINNFRLLGAGKIIVVTGFRSDDIDNELRGCNIKILKNENYGTTEMFDSVCIGLMELINAVDMTFVTPVDSPFVQQFTLKKMVEEMTYGKLDVVQPAYGGREGHPLLLSNDAAMHMLKHDGTMGMQGAISGMKKHMKINFADPGIVMDADNMTDYFKLLEYFENKNIPSVELCEKIQDYFNMTDNIKRHCGMVAHVALNLCVKLSQKGIDLNRDIVVAASMLHDIAKGNPMHAKTGAMWLRDMGYAEIAGIVEEHMELKTISCVPTEKEVVFLADKMVMGDKIVSIDERFSHKENLYNHDEEIIKKVAKRKEQALEIFGMIYS